ncbi:MAG: hypothetical protein H0U74_20200 [Bradymonadaceae bacterium]|nr:hypothetical protein [Lujinxingiaceae bacterium]
MARKIRYQESNLLYFVSNRCLEQRFFLQSGSETNALFLNCLARAAFRYKICVYGFVFMNNHFHLIVSAPHLNLNLFMAHFQTGITRGLNKISGRARGSIFPERYNCVVLQNDQVAFDKLIYLLANPCAADLVEDPSDFPGVSSLGMHLSGEAIAVSWRGQHKIQGAELARAKLFQLTPLPGLAAMDEFAQRKLVLKELELRCIKLSEARGPKSVLGREGVLSRTREQRPVYPKFSPAPLVLGSDEQVKKYLEHLHNVHKAYQKARRSLYTRKREKFPPGTIRPGTCQCVPHRLAGRRNKQAAKSAGGTN